MSTPLDAAPSRILNHDQFEAATRAARERFAQIRQKHPRLKGCLVLAIPGRQTGIGSSAKEILSDLPALVVDDAAKAAITALLKTPPPKDASEAQKREANKRFEEAARDLSYDASVRVEVRFDHLDYELIWQLQSDELVDRELTPQTRASIRIVLGTLAAFAP